MKILHLIILSLPLLLVGQEKNIDISSATTDYDKDLLPASFFANNRQALRNAMPKNSVAVLFSSPIRNRSNDVDYEYHQDPNFYYLTGLTEPHAVLIIYKEVQEFQNNLKTDEILFLKKKHTINERWTGKTHGLEGARLNLGLNVAMENEHFLNFRNNYQDFDKVLIFKELDDVRKTDQKADLFKLLKSFNLKIKNLDNINSSYMPKIMANLRQIKSEEEIVLLRKAAKITCEAQIELMKGLKPEMTEFQSEAIVEYVFKKNGAEHPGFPSILGGGENSCIIHYNSNRKKLTANDLLVSDVGAEYHGYSADVTRTIPVNGQFSAEEKIIYNIVLKAEQAGIESCKVGNKFWDPHYTATKIITNELMALGIIKKPYHVQRYFMHGTSHYLGLDVHDPGLHGTLTPGNVITVEPGIYIPEGSDCDPKWWNIGVRIEDDILITLNGPDNLSALAPRKIEEIEALMRQKSSFE